jgi:prophage regulatory protein
VSLQFELNLNRKELHMQKLVTAQQLRIIRLKEVLDRTALSRSTIYNKLDPDSTQFDPKFPNSISLGASSIGWIAAEIDIWINRRKKLN